MPDDLLSQGIAAIKAGNVQQARQLLDGAIKQNPNDERGWGWFYNVAANDEERLRCIKQVLRINPNNKKAKEIYDKLIGLNYVPQVVAPIQYSQNKLPTNNSLMYFVVFTIIVIFVTWILRGGLSGLLGPNNVEYRVTGTPYNVSIAYENSTGNYEQITTTLPWSYPKFAASHRQYLSVAVQTEWGGVITCEILVNGVVVKTATSQGQYATAICSGSAP